MIITDRGRESKTLHTREKTPSSSHITIKRKEYNTSNKIKRHDHCWDIPLTILGNGTSIPIREAGGHAKSDYSKTLEYLKPPEEYWVSNKNKLTSDRDSNFPHLKDIQSKCQSEVLSLSTLVPPPNNGRGN